MMREETASRRATQTYTLRLGDCVEVLRGLEVGSIGAFVCDPPYG